MSEFPIGRSFVTLKRGRFCYGICENVCRILRAMLYRLLKSRMTAAFLAVLTILIVYGIAGLKVIGADAALSADASATSSDIALGLSVLAGGTGGVDFIHACGMLFVRGSLISMVVAVFFGVFFASDLKSGAAIENLLYSALGLITGHPSEVRAIFDGYLAVTVSQLGYGNVLTADALMPIFLTIIAEIIAGVLVLRRRSLA